MPDEPTESEQAELIAEPVDPEPGRLEPIPRRAPSSNGAVDGLVDLTARVVTPVVQLGWRTARGMGRRLGFNDAVRHQVDRALDSDTAARTTQQVLESDAANQVWDKVLESEQAQKLVERVAEAPEVRSAITSQGLGLLEDVRRSARRAARRLDDELERCCAGAPAAPRAQRPIYAGGATRLLAIGFDAAVLSGILLLISALLATVLNAFFSLDGERTARRSPSALRLVDRGEDLPGLFWILAERTPGMTFFALRISTESGGHVSPARTCAGWSDSRSPLIPFGLGFLGILTNERRRGWHDRFAGTVVLYADPEIDSGLPGWTPPPVRAEPSRAAERLPAVRPTAGRDQPRACARRGPGRRRRILRQRDLGLDAAPRLPAPPAAAAPLPGDDPPRLHAARGRLDDRGHARAPRSGSRRAPWRCPPASGSPSSSRCCLAGSTASREPRAGRS